MKIKNMDESIEVLKEKYDFPLQLSDFTDIKRAINSWKLDKFASGLPQWKADELQQFLDTFSQTWGAFNAAEDKLKSISALAFPDDFSDIDKMCQRAILLIECSKYACQKIKTLIPYELKHYESENIQECNNRRVNESVDVAAFTKAIEGANLLNAKTPEEVSEKGKADAQKFIKDVDKHLKTIYDLDQLIQNINLTNKNSEYGKALECGSTVLNKAYTVIDNLKQYFQACIGDDASGKKKHGLFKRLREATEVIDIPALANMCDSWELGDFEEPNKDVRKNMETFKKMGLAMMQSIAHLNGYFESLDLDDEFESVSWIGYRILESCLMVIEKLDQMTKEALGENLKECGGYCDDNSCEDGECEDELFELFHRKPTLEDACRAEEMGKQFGAEIETLETKIKEATTYKENAKLQKELDRKKKDAQDCIDVINEYNANLEKAAEKLAKKAAKKNVKESINAYRKDGRLYADNGVSVIYNLEESYEANMNRLERKIKTLDLLHK